MDAGSITAQRTAGVSGTAIRLFAPAHAGASGPRRPARSGGAGAQPLAGHRPSAAGLRRPGDRPGRRTGRSAGFLGRARSTASVRSKWRPAHERPSRAPTSSFRSSRSGRPTRRWTGTGWAPRRSSWPWTTTCRRPPPSPAEALFVIDERDQFLATRAAGEFAGYPDPQATLGEVLREGRAPAGRPRSGIASGRRAGRRRLRLRDPAPRRTAGAGPGVAPLSAPADQVSG